MNRRQLWPGIGASLGMLVLILDGQTALEGGRAGIELCLKTVIPSLFPFFLLSIVLTSSFSGSSLPLLRPLAHLCGIPNGAESILISGFLGGYPVGAQSIATAYHCGQLKKADAERMLAFCNNAGPAFIFGMISSLFPSMAMVWALWGIQIVSAIMVAVILPRNSSQDVKISGTSTVSVSGALHSALRVMATVCGWVILFRVMITFLQRWVLWLLPTDMQIALIGILELSNGCSELHSVAEIAARFIICSGVLAFGGLCVTMQTMSVTNGLSLRYYFPGKLLQTAFSITICIGILQKNWILFFAILVLSSISFRKKQKKSSIRHPVGV